MSISRLPFRSAWAALSCSQRCIGRPLPVDVASARAEAFTSFRCIATPAAPMSPEAQTSASKDPEPGAGARAEVREGDSSGHASVSVQFRGNEIFVSRGAVLRTALLQNGLTPHNGKAVFANCRGAGVCGTCAVQIEGSVLPPTWGGQEAMRLSMPPHRAPNNSRLRLACSVQLDGDVKVTKYDKLWGQPPQSVAGRGRQTGHLKLILSTTSQGDVPLEPIPASKSVTPFGDLEFVLDFKKKKDKPQ